MAFGDPYGSRSSSPSQPPKRYDPLGDFVRAHYKKFLYGIGGLFALIFILSAFYTVGQGERAVVTRFGAAVRVTEPGGHFKLPLLEGVTLVPVGTQSVEWAHYRPDEENKQGKDTRMESYSRDQQPAHLSVKVTYHAKPDEKSIIELFGQYRTVDGVADKVLIPNVYEAVKSTFGHYTAQEAIQNRDKFNTDIYEALLKLIPKDAPVSLEAIKIQDIKFDDRYENAIKLRMEAEVEVTKVAQNLEKEKKEAEITVVKAKAEADSNLARAKADAESTRIKGEAEAAAIRARSAALQSNPALVQLTLAERWNGVLPTTVAPNGTVPFLPLAKHE